MCELIKLKIAAYIIIVGLIIGYWGYSLLNVVK
jgi:hypothetical protein